METVNITINGIEKRIEKSTTITSLLKKLGVYEKTMAVAVNMKIVKKDEWDKFTLNDGDKIEALNFVGGG